MTAQEKWQRLKNPKTLGDYGLSLNEREMSDFPNGRAILCEIKKLKRQEKKDTRIISLLGSNTASTMEGIMIKFLLKQ